jgi:hypothetical protein
MTEALQSHQLHQQSHPFLALEPEAITSPRSQHSLHNPNNRSSQLLRNFQDSLQHHRLRVVKETEVSQ